MIPHLTLGDGIDDTTQHDVRDALGDQLPVVVTLRSAWLMTFDGRRWRTEAEFPLDAP